MSGTRLQDVLEIVYASNAVVHILSGKEVACAVRQHFLVDATLIIMVTSAALRTQLPPSSDNSQWDENTNSEGYFTPDAMLCEPHYATEAC